MSVWLLASDWEERFKEPEIGNLERLQQVLAMVQLAVRSRELPVLVLFDLTLLGRRS